MDDLNFLQRDERVAEVRMAFVGTNGPWCGLYLERSKCRGVKLRDKSAPKHESVANTARQKKKEKKDWKKLKANKQSRISKAGRPGRRKASRTK